MYYIAVYISDYWYIPDSKYFLDKLNSMIDFVEDKDKAIIYYLNANNISYHDTEWRSNDAYRINLLKSIEYSKKIKFVYNRVEMARISERKEAKYYLEEARANVEEIGTKEILDKKPINIWLSSQRYINEFILGTSMSEEVFNFIFGNN